jgi:hypothetical protein
MPFRKFVQNGGLIKTLLIIILGMCGWLIKLGFCAGKYDSRLCNVETKVTQHDEILKAIPEINTNLAEIRADMRWLKKEGRK